MSFTNNELYRVLNISKQAVHQYSKRQAIFDQQVIALVKKAEAYKKGHPGCGVEKLYYALAPDFIGRDRFIDLMMQLGFRVKRKKNYKRTTYSTKRFYSNKIKGLKLNSKGQVWQSDITYISVGQKHYYAVFIIDVYTKQIVGYKVSDHMRASANIIALANAILEHGPPEIHHSDRGSQYGSGSYTDLLDKHETEISMGLCAQDNAYAERINRTIKEEYLAYWDIKTFSQLKARVRRAVFEYNNNRPHNHLNRKTPNDFSSKIKSIKKQERAILTIFEETNLS